MGTAAIAAALGLQSTTLAVSAHTDVQTPHTAPQRDEQHTAPAAGSSHVGFAASALSETKPRGSAQRVTFQLVRGGKAARNDDWHRWGDANLGRLTAALGTVAQQHPDAIGFLRIEVPFGYRDAAQSLISRAAKRAGLTISNATRILLVNEWSTGVDDNFDLAIIPVGTIEWIVNHERLTRAQLVAKGIAVHSDAKSLGSALDTAGTGGRLVLEHALAHQLREGKPTTLLDSLYERGLTLIAVGFIRGATPPAWGEIHQVVPLDRFSEPKTLQLPLTIPTIAL